MIGHPIATSSNWLTHPAMSVERNTLRKSFPPHGSRKHRLLPNSKQTKPLHYLYFGKRAAQSPCAPAARLTRRRNDHMTAEPRLKPSLVCLQRAVLCANCEIISEANNGHCAACGSEAVLSLSKVLGGPLKSDLAPEFSPATPADDMPLERFLSAAA
jgi:hypothetical protein